MIKPYHYIDILIKLYILYIAMGILQSEPAVLLSNRINGLTSVVLSVFLFNTLEINRCEPLPEKTYR